MYAHIKIAYREGEGGSKMAKMLRTYYMDAPPSCVDFNYLHGIVFEWTSTSTCIVTYHAYSFEALV